MTIHATTLASAAADVRFNFQGCEERQATYRITNVANGRFYIGSARNLRARWSSHAIRLQHGTHENRLLQADYDRFGADAFVFDVIGLFESSGARLDAEDVLIKAHHDGGDRCYNIHAWVTRGSLGWTPSQEQRERSSAARRGQPRSEDAKRKAADKHRGTKRSAETRAKIADAARRRVQSEETRAKISASLLARRRSP